MTWYLFSYDVLTIVLFTFSLTLTAINFSTQRMPYYKISALLISLYLLDHILIFTTECFDQFKYHYTVLFFNSPALKTIYIIPISTCYLFLATYILKRPLTQKDFAPIILHTIYLLFIPFISNKALNIWLYFLPSQLYLIGLTLYVIKQIKFSNLHLTNSYYLKLIKQLRIIILLSLLVIIEDTIVIFNYDVFSDTYLHMTVRNFFEDALKVSMCCFILYEQLLNKHSVPTHTRIQQDVTIDDEYLPPTLNELDLTIHHTLTDSSICLTRFNEFCINHQLSTREKEILLQLIQNNNNKEISETLFISIGTVKAHVHNIYQKTNVKKRSELMMLYQSFFL